MSHHQNLPTMTFDGVEWAQLPIFALETTCDLVNDNWESLITSTVDAPIPNTTSSPIINALYSAWLLVNSKSSLNNS